MYSILFVCVFTSIHWSYDTSCEKGEIFRFDRILLLGQVNIYHLFAGLFFLIVFFVKFDPHSNGSILGDKNYLKNIFWMYFVPVNILIYIATYTQNISLEDLGVFPIAKFFIYLIVVYYVQDIFFRDKDSKQLNNSLTILELLILIRCCYSIFKYLLGFGAQNPITGGVRLGQENDFADFFILLFIIALTRLLFGKNENKWNRVLHILGIITSSCVAIFSFRRYFLIELLIAIAIISFFHYRFNVANFNKKIIAVCLSVVFIIGMILFLGPNRLIHNYYIGRMLSSLSLLSYKYESQYGTGTGHGEEIRDGWYNVKKNWLLGVTPFGVEKIQRFETREWQTGYFVHNGYLQVWLIYGLLGFILFIFLYFKSLQLGHIVFFKFNNKLGLILIAFIACQMVKNIVVPTAIRFENITVIYIFLISLVLKAKRLEDLNNINDDDRDN